MKLESEKGARCCECGAEQTHMIRMERGGPYCYQCLSDAVKAVAPVSIVRGYARYDGPDEAVRGTTESEAIPMPGIITDYLRG